VLFCPNMKLIMVSQFADGSKRMDMVHVRCKQWTCPYCAPANAKQWKDYILKRLAREDFRDQFWIFVTITAHEDSHKHSPQATLRNLQRGWNKLYHRFKTFNGHRAFDYVRVFERHENGKFGGYHMHLIMALGNAFARHKDAFAKVLEREKIARKQGKKPRKRLKREKHPARWLKDASRACKMGYQTDVRQIGSNTQHVAPYMTKYISKQLEILDFPPRMRRIQASVKFGSPRRRDTGNVRKWRPRTAIYKTDLEDFDLIFDVTRKHVITEGDFPEGVFWYPKELK